jgi:hypothetical protein
VPDTNSDEGLPFRSRPPRPMGWISRDGRLSPALPPWLVVPDRPARIVGPAVAAGYVLGMGLYVYRAFFTKEWWLSQGEPFISFGLGACFCLACLIAGGVSYLILHWLHRWTAPRMPRDLTVQPFRATDDPLPNQDGVTTHQPGRPDTSSHIRSADRPD